MEHVWYSKTKIHAIQGIGVKYYGLHIVFQQWQNVCWECFCGFRCSRSIWAQNIGFFLDEALIGNLIRCWSFIENKMEFSTPIFLKFAYKIFHPIVNRRRTHVEHFNVTLKESGLKWRNEIGHLLEGHFIFLNYSCNTILMTFRCQKLIT